MLLDYLKWKLFPIICRPSVRPSQMTWLDKVIMHISLRKWFIVATTHQKLSSIM